MKNNKVIIIGAGIGGLTAGALLAKIGYEVTILEKNSSIGGRAMHFLESGYTFDMGSPWYIMPEVYERLFAHFGKKPSDFYELTKLKTNYRMFFGKNQIIDMSEDMKENLKQFEAMEKGSAKLIKDYFAKSKSLYDFSMKHVAYKNHNSLFDRVRFSWARAVLTAPIFDSLEQFVSRYTKHKQLQKVLLYSSLFIGNSPHQTPALYSALSNIDAHTGVFYPQGGMHQVVKALEALCKEYGVTIKLRSPVEKIITKDNIATSVLARNMRYNADFIISNADYAHTELRLLDEEHRTYYDEHASYQCNISSAFIMYLGVKGGVKKLKHHTFIIANDWDEHFNDTLEESFWPKEPLIYITTPSKTDPSVAPKGCDVLRVYVPISAGIKDTPEARAAFKEKIIQRIEDMTGEDIRSQLVVDRVFTLKDYQRLYNSHRGGNGRFTTKMFNTGFIHSNNKSMKVQNLFYAGQDSLPGIGMGLAVISAELATLRVIEADKQNLKR
ncbi:MAG: phytoene desaturase family protein [bacterium]|nr:phytoene desaturase family protein [bacterium]